MRILLLRCLLLYCVSSSTIDWTGCGTYKKICLAPANCKNTGLVEYYNGACDSRGVTFTRVWDREWVVEFRIGLKAGKNLAIQIPAGYLFIDDIPTNKIPVDSPPYGTTSHEILSNNPDLHDRFVWKSQNESVESILLDGKLIFSINAGSDTISLGKSELTSIFNKYRPPPCPSTSACDAHESICSAVDFSKSGDLACEKPKQLWYKVNNKWNATSSVVCDMGSYRIPNGAALPEPITNMICIEAGTCKGCPNAGVTISEKEGCPVVNSCGEHKALLDASTKEEVEVKCQWKKEQMKSIWIDAKSGREIKKMECADPPRTANNDTWIIVGVVGGFVVLLIIGCVLAYFFYFRKKLRREKPVLGSQGLRKEFDEINTETKMDRDAKACKANKDKNRYPDIVCVENERVILEGGKNKEDYIHANTFRIPGGREIICTQGPKDETIVDFWRMIWQENCKCIIMACNLWENNKLKCAAYWPTREGEMVTHGELTIKCVKRSDFDEGIACTNLEVSKGKKFKSTRVVIHYQVKNWPDHGVLKDATPCLKMLQATRGYGKTTVHCSAGVGRTGTIVCIESILSRLMSGDEDVDMKQAVINLRVSRDKAVQEPEQYLFIAKAIATFGVSIGCVKEEEVKNLLAL